MKNITFTFFLFLSFCSFSFENVQKAKDTEIVDSATKRPKAQQTKQAVKKKILTEDERAALIEAGKLQKQLKNAQKETEKSASEQLFSTQKQNRFKTHFPSLARLDSKVLKELGTPLAFPKGFSSGLWFKCNPVYGALLWKNKVIHNLAFLLTQPDNSSGFGDLIQNFFEGIGPHETIINKDSPKDNLGCVAGHLFLYEQGKIKNFDELSVKIQQNCKREFDSKTLKALFNQEDQGEVKIKDFLPSVISTFVYAASRQFSTPETAAEYLQRYRYEFKNAIKSSYNNQLTSYKSLVDEDLNDLCEEMKFFKESFNILCESFIGFQVPSGLEFIKDLTYKAFTWSDCNETAFTNWVLGITYNPENHKFEPEKVTTNEILKDSLSKTNGFDSLFNQSALSGALQNVSFVIYKQIQIGSDKFTFHGVYPQGIVVVPHEFYEKLSFPDIKLKKSQYLCKDSSSSRFSLGGKYFGQIYFIDQAAYPDAFSFDLDSSPVNFLVLCHHLGFPSLREKFQSAQEIFEIAMKPNDEIYEVLNDCVSKYECKVTRKSNDVLLEFPFGFFDIPLRHSIFDFTGKNITLKSSELLESDNFFKIIFSEEDNFSDQFQRLCWALLKKKIPKNLQNLDSLNMKPIDFLEKIGFPNTEYFIIDLIIKNPTFLKEIEQGSLGYEIFWKIGCEFEDQDSIFFFLLRKKITDRNILLKFIEALFESFNTVWAEEFYHPSTRNQGLLKAYGGLFFASCKNPRKAKEFVLNDLATNYQSFEREALMNLILEFCSFVGEDNQNEMMAILRKLPFLTKEYLKGFSFSFSTQLEQSKSENYKRIVSPSFYAAFALRYDLSLEFIKKIGNEPFDHEFDQYFEGLEIEQEKFDQLKGDFGNFEFFKEMESIIKVKKEGDESQNKIIDEELSRKISDLL